MNRKVRLISATLATLLAMIACNLPSAAPSTQSASTAAAQTVQAQLTGIAQTAVPSQAPLSTSTPLPSLTPIPPSATPTCDLGKFVTDVTIPDGTIMTPGQSFTKTWRLQNIGACNWSGYSLVFDSGDSMGASSATYPVGTTVTNAFIDISINLTAPTSSGSYRGYWRLRNASGVLIPIVSGYQGRSFYVDIKVQAPASAGFDLHSQAPSAQWISCGDPCGGGTVLSFGGPDTDANGFVMYRNGALLEDGSSPAKVLETHPMWVDDGVISGLYPAYTVQPDEHFQAKLGFLAKADGTCGLGNVKFQLNYKEAGTLHPLGSWTDTCNGTLLSVDVDLSALEGHTVQFALVALANGPATQDWAVWVSPRVAAP